MDKEHDERRYNGWANYETWTVGLWLDNEEHTYRYWREEAHRHRQEAGNASQVLEGIWTESEAARFNLADQLKESITDEAPVEKPSLYSDLLSAALSEVDWLEIVDHWMAE